MAVYESDLIEIDGDAPNELEFKEEDGYAELVFKSCWYLMALVVFIVAGSIILMGIEGHYFMFENLNKFEQREHFEQRLSQVRFMTLTFYQHALLDLNFRLTGTEGVRESRWHDLKPRIMLSQFSVYPPNICIPRQQVTSSVETTS